MCSFLPDDQDQPMFTISLRGQSKLTHKGYLYVKSHEIKTKGVIAWRCVQRKTSCQCKGKAQTGLDGANITVKITHPHNHPSVI